MNDKELEEKLTLLDHLQSACTNCGLCSEACATFQASGWEHESPRGRLQLASQFLHGRIHPHSTSLSTFDRCLGCHACEPLCPHHVPYSQVRHLVQELRRDLQTSSTSVMERGQYQHWITLASRIGNIWWRRYGVSWLNIPFLTSRKLSSFVRKSPPMVKETPLLAICCVQDLFQHEVIEQTLTFVRRLGYSLQVDPKQPCCGALFERLVHGGEESVCYAKEQQKAKDLQHKTHKAFMQWLPAHTYFLAKGCQSFLAKSHASVLDLYAWIESLLDQQHLTLYFSPPREVYYQPYCHSDSQAKDSIWHLFKRIEGLTVRYISQPKSCCGGYCGETLLHVEQAQAIAEQKISNVPTHATLIVTSPDCWSLFKRHAVGQELTLLYPIQLLAQTLLKKEQLF